MKCDFCGRSVLTETQRKGKPLTLSGVGIGHRECIQKFNLSHRVFGNIFVRDLSTKELVELREMVLNEYNDRQNAQSCELF